MVDLKFRRVVAADSKCVEAHGDLDHAYTDLLYTVRMDERKKKMAYKEKRVKDETLKNTNMEG